MTSALRVPETLSSAPPAPSRVSVTDLLLLLMALVWGVNFIVVKFGTRVLAPLAFNSTRIALAVVILWAVVVAARLQLPARGDLLGLLGLGVLGNGLYQILFIEGLSRTRASDAALIVSAAPAFIEVVHWFQGGERIGRRGAIGIAVSLAGIALVVSGGARGTAGEGTLLGNALVLGACVCWSLYSVWLKPFTERVNPVALSAVTMSGGLVALLVVSVPALRGTPWAALDIRAWSAVAYSGILALVVAYLFFYRGVRVLGATRTSMYANLQPVVTMTVAAIALHESPHALQLAGAACILGGVVLTRLAAPACGEAA